MNDFRTRLRARLSFLALVAISAGCSNAPRDEGPIAGSAFEWKYVEFPDATCRDGTSTGIGVSLNPASTKVAIYLEGGGACFNEDTCEENPSHFDSGNFLNLTGDGIAIRAEEANPIRDWNMFFIPYCTGDLHAGSNPDTGGANGVPSNQRMVGYDNMRHYLKRIVSTVPDASEVLLTGESAGGWGAFLNFNQVQRAFGDTPVTLIDDSGPPLAANWLPPCMQDGVRKLWNLDDTLLAECGAACPKPDDYVESYVKYTFGLHPNRSFGLISNLGDWVIAWFLGYGRDGCTGTTDLAPEELAAGLEDFRDRVVQPFANVGTYYLPGTDHTILTSNDFYYTDVGDTSLADWMTAMLAGRPSHVRP
jgi:hypothetical protein